MRLILIIATLASVLVSLPATAGELEAQSGAEIPWQVIAGGGRNDGASTNFSVAGTVGQTAAGAGGSTNFGIEQGFWIGGPGFTCGDANADLLVNITDAVLLIQYIFNGGPAPLPVAAGDVNCDALTNITDAVYLIQYIFNGGPAPCAACL